jgi:hypothetical protein
VFNRVEQARGGTISQVTSRTAAALRLSCLLRQRPDAREYAQAPDVEAGETGDRTDQESRSAARAAAVSVTAMDHSPDLCGW